MGISGDMWKDILQDHVADDDYLSSIGEWNNNVHWMCAVSSTYTLNYLWLLLWVELLCNSIYLCAWNILDRPYFVIKSVLELTGHMQCPGYVQVSLCGYKGK